MAEQVPLCVVPATFFDVPGPQITKPEHGPEPSLRTVLKVYYASSGMSKEAAEQCADDYIMATLRKHGIEVKE